jgi:hypothetical protein
MMDLLFNTKLTTLTSLTSIKHKSSVKGGSIPTIGTLIGPRSGTTASLSFLLEPLLLSEGFSWLLLDNDLLPSNHW